MALLDDGGDDNPGPEQYHERYDSEDRFHFYLTPSEVIYLLHVHDTVPVFRRYYAKMKYGLRLCYGQVTRGAGRRRGFV